MVLGFKKQFVDKIKNGSKIHTIREDKHKRWKEGNTIHFATGVRTKKYKQFISGMCFGVQEIYIDNEQTVVMVDGRRLTFYEIETLAKNDGFDSVCDFLKWFGDNFTGRIIHWTKLKY